MNKNLQLELENEIQELEDKLKISTGKHINFTSAEIHSEDLSNAKKLLTNLTLDNITRIINTIQRVKCLFHSEIV